jgi:hypothetical protein
MSRSVNAEMHRMVRKIRPAVLARGIRIIPDEVLALILQSLYNDWGTEMDPMDNPEYMRLVCKRFKDVIDSHPSFKAFLSTSMSRAEISRRVEHLGTSVGLQLCFDVKDTSFSIFVDSVIPLAHHWEGVTFNVTGKVGIDVEATYTRLKTLSLSRLKRFIFWRVESLRREEAEMVYSGWDAPNLVDVDCTNVVPCDLRHKSVIKSFKLLEDHNCESFNMAYFDRLSSFLGTLLH